MILDRDRSTHIGKTIEYIDSDDFDGGLMMCHEIVIGFTDGSKIILKNDWRGNECYISEYTE